MKCYCFIYLSEVNPSTNIVNVYFTVKYTLLIYNKFTYLFADQTTYLCLNCLYIFQTLADFILFISASHFTCSSVSPLFIKYFHSIFLVSVSFTFPPLLFSYPHLVQNPVHSNLAFPYLQADNVSGGMVRISRSDWQIELVSCANVRCKVYFRVRALGRCRKWPDAGISPVDRGLNQRKDEQRVGRASVSLSGLTSAKTLHPLVPLDSADFCKISLWRMAAQVGLQS